MAGDEIGFSEISDVYRNERRSKILTKLPPHFHELAEEHLKKLRGEHCDALKTPNNPTAMMLWDQVTKVDKRLKLIYEMRERKITLAALDRMVGAQPPDNMSRVEKALYEQLVETLLKFRAGEDAKAQVECPPKVAVPDAPKPEPVMFVQPAAPEPALAATPEEPQDLTLVHVLEDIPEFAGMSQNYELKKDDLVTLPSRFAKVLSSRGLVRIIPG